MRIHVGKLHVRRTAKKPADVHPIQVEEGPVRQAPAFAIEASAALLPKRQPGRQPGDANTALEAGLRHAVPGPLANTIARQLGQVDMDDPRPISQERPAPLSQLQAPGALPEVAQVVPIQEITDAPAQNAALPAAQPQAEEPMRLDATQESATPQDHSAPVTAPEAQQPTEAPAPQIQNPENAPSEEGDEQQMAAEAELPAQEPQADQPAQLPPPAAEGNDPGTNNNGGGQGQGGNAGGNQGGGGGIGGGPELTPFEQAPAALDTSASGPMVQSLGKQQPTAIVATLGAVPGQLSTAQQGDLEQAKTFLPEIEQPTGLGTDGIENKKEAKSELKEEKAPEIQQPKDGKKQDVKIEHKVPEGQSPADKVKTPSNEALKSAGGLGKAIQNIPEVDPSISTSAGPRPQVELTGDADPQHNQTAQLEADTSTQEASNKAQTETEKDFKEGEILPAIEKETMKVSQELTAPEGWSGEGGAVLPQLDAQSAAALNSGILAQHQAQLDAELAKETEGKAEFDQQAKDEQQKGLDKIKEENEKVKQQQLNERAKGKETIDGHREEWRAENDKVMQDFDTKSKAEREKVDGKIQSKVAETNAKVDSEYAKAEGEAKAKTESAQQEIDAKKEEAEKKEQDKSWWDKMCDAVSDFFDALKEAVSAIFDALKKAVKAIIEAAKQLASQLIDMARDLIKGLISAFAEMLKAFVRLALAAFPELAEKFCAMIDQAVEAIHKAIDQLAEALKTVVNMLLDAIGAAINALLDAYNAIINAILSAIEFLAVGWIKIMEGIANLVVAAYKMPGHLFWNEILIALLGTNPTDPIPGIERVGQVEGQAAPAGPQGPDPDQALLDKDELSPDDVEFDEVHGADALSPEVIDELEAMEEGEYPFEGVPDPITMQDFRQGAAPVAEAPGEQTEEAGSGPDFANMSDDQKLQWYLDGMASAPAGGESAEGESQESGQQEVPDVMKVGPLSVGQRMWFFGEQLKIGISKWWQENRGWIIPSVILAVICVVAAIVLTGGAALAPILSALMTALTVVFGAILVAQIAGHLWDYITKAWDGDTEGGAVSLAKAFAVGMVELIFTLIFKGIGKLLKAIVRGAKSALRGLKTLMRQSAQLAKRVGQAMLRNGKIIFQNVKASVLRGFRKVRDVTKKLTEKLRLGFGKITITAEWIIIELRFNPTKIVLRFRRRLHREGNTQLQGVQVRGFRNAGEVMERLGNLKNNIRNIKIGNITLDDAVVGIRGSSVTGTSSKGGLFRWEQTAGGGKISDVDFFFHSQKLEDLLVRKGFNPNAIQKGRISPEQLSAFDPAIARILDTFGEATTKQLGGRSANVYLLTSDIMNTLKKGEYLIR